MHAALRWTAIIGGGLAILLVIGPFALLVAGLAVMAVRATGQRSE